MTPASGGPPRDAERLALRTALRALHRALLVAVQKKFEKLHGRVEGPGELLQLAAHDPLFAWLAPLSANLAAIEALDANDGARGANDGVRGADDGARGANDGALDANDGALDATGVDSAPLAALRAELRRLLEDDAAFRPTYLVYLQSDADVVVAHAAVRKLLDRR